MDDRGVTAVATGPRSLAELSTQALVDAARSRRDSAFGTRITYSPKVFIPLTRLCRDRCGYCTFATAPRSLTAPYLSADEVLAIASAGAEAGCHEALFTLGESPESRYPEARAWLDTHGFSSTVDYLRAMCDLVLTETGLLPHANAGAISADELASLRPVAPSQGMMIESLRPDLAAHRGAPDKTPERRLATLDAAGHLAIPFTTGILVGIGETEVDRIDALCAIADSHAQHRHVQEAIVQNFLPKRGTAMRAAPACPAGGSPAGNRAGPADPAARRARPGSAESHRRGRAGRPARRRHRRLGRRFTGHGRPRESGTPVAGVGHAAPCYRRPRLRAGTSAHHLSGVRAAARTLARSGHALSGPRPFRRHWAGPRRPGRGLAERHQAAANVGTGAEVVQIGRRSTAWYAGAEVTPKLLLPTRPAARGAVRDVLDAAGVGDRLGEDELVILLGARGPEVAAVAELADQLRREAVGDAVTYVINRNINYTNVCTFRCTFCGFSKGPLSLNLRGKPYLLSLDEIAGRAREAWDRGATEVCMQGGIHPSFDGNFYVEAAQAVHDAVPGMHIHGFTALEVTEGARRLGEPLTDYLTRLKRAGLKTLPGTAAEILDDDVRQVLCPDKVNTEEWLAAHEAAHAVGLRSNVTMMFGAIEQPRHWARHFLVTRALQDRTGGFTEFVGLPFVHMAAPIYLKRAARRGPTWREVVLVHAVARIALSRIDPERPGLLGEARSRGRGAAPSRRSQRPRRHPHGGEHQPGRGRDPRPGAGCPGVRRRCPRGRPIRRATDNALRTDRRVSGLTGRIGHAPNRLQLQRPRPNGTEARRRPTQE